MLNFSQRRWSVELLKKYQCDPLPFSSEFMSSATIIGNTESGVTVFAGGHDHSCISVCLIPKTKLSLQEHGW